MTVHTRLNNGAADAASRTGALNPSAAHLGEHPFIWHEKNCVLGVSAWGVTLSVEGEIVSRVEYPRTARCGSSFQTADRAVSGSLWAYAGKEVSLQLHTDKLWIDLSLWRDADGHFSIHAVPDVDCGPRVPESELRKYEASFSFAH